MRNLMLLIALVAGLSIPTNLLSQGTYDSHQIIIDFADDVLQADIDEYLDMIDGTIIDQIDDDVFLVEIESFPIEYTDINGEEVVFYNVVDIIEHDYSKADIDNADLNYIIFNSPMNFEQLVENLPIDYYSPIPSYLDEYSGLLNCNELNLNQKVRVGIIDTGVDPNHSFINDYVVFEANVYNDESSAVDDNGHGTKVAGIIAGVSQSAGIPPDNLELYIIKALDENGQGYYFNMLKAVKLANQLDLDVLNLSWGFHYNYYYTQQGNIFSSNLINTASELQETLAENDKQLIICGAGNQNMLLGGGEHDQFQDFIHYGPADFLGQSSDDQIITVGAIDELGGIANFSNYGKCLDIFAPGVQIVAPTLNGFWSQSNSGTSFASAIITAGIVQIWVSNSNEITFHLPIIDYGGNNFSETDSAPKVINLLKDHSILLGETLLSTSLGDISLPINGIDLSFLCTNNDFQSFNQSYSNKQIQNKEEELKAKRDNNTSVDVFPNPVYDKFEIHFKNVSEGKVNIELLDLFGVKIYTKQLFLNSEKGSLIHEIFIGNMNLPSGSYFLKINEGEKTVLKKIKKI